MSPAAFLHQLTEKARVAQKRIVLPEGAEPRTIRTAAICARHGVARCVLLGDPKEIEAVAKSQDLNLPMHVELLDPVAARLNTSKHCFGSERRKGFRSGWLQANWKTMWCWEL